MSQSKDIAVADQPQQLITIEPAKYVEIVFEPFAKRLAAAKVAAEGVSIDVTTTAGMAVAIKHRATFREIRVASEKARKERKAPILEIGKLLDSRQKEIEAEIEPFESRFDDAIKAEEARKESEKQAKAEAEKARVDGIKAKIEAFMLNAVTAAKSSSAEIDAYATRLSEMVIDIKEYQEFAGEAQMKRNKTVEYLREMQTKAIEHEAEQARIAAERAELERLRVEAAERERTVAAERAEQERVARITREKEEARLREEREAHEAELRKQREAEEDKLRAEREQAEAALRAQREELARQQAEIDRQRAEAERVEQERLAEIETERRRQQAEAEEVARAHAREQERRAREEFELTGPHASEILEVLAAHYQVEQETVLKWINSWAWAEVEIAA